MEDNPSIVSKLKQEFRGSRGPRILMGVGAIIAILACIGLSTVGSISQDRELGSVGSTFATLLSLGATAMMCGGAAIAIAGVATGLLRNLQSGINAAGNSLARSSSSSPSDRPASTVSLPIEQRRNILQGQINRFLGQGYRVVSQTDTAAQLVRPKSFSCLWATLWLLFFGIGLLIYLFWYWSQRDDQLYIEVDSTGGIKLR